MASYKTATEKMEDILMTVFELLLDQIDCIDCPIYSECIEETNVSCFELFLKYGAKEVV